MFTIGPILSKYLILDLLEYIYDKKECKFVFWNLCTKSRKFLLKNISLINTKFNTVSVLPFENSMLAFNDYKNVVLNLNN